MSHRSGTWLKALGCLAVIASLAGCGGGGGGGFNADPPAAQAGELSASPASVAFGSLAVGARLSQTLTLTNTGTASLNITQAAVSGPGFSVSGLSLPLALSQGQSVRFSANFAPASAGSASGTVSIVSDASNSPSTVSLSGTGTSLQIAVSPAAVSFGSVKVGSSGAQTITVKNTGSSSVTVSDVKVAGPAFSANGFSVPTTLGAGQAASLGATFTPTAVGNSAGSITVVSNASDSPSTVSLSGAGVEPALAASPASVNFGAVSIGSNSTQTVALINSGTSSVTVTQASVAGTGFTLSGLSLPANVGAGQILNFSASFSPAAAGSATGTISVVSNASSLPLLVPLSGVGGTLQLTVTPSSVNFGSVQTGGSATQALTLNNTGSSPVTITQATVSGAAFTISGLSLPLTLGAGQNASFSAKFVPTAAGTATGSVSVLSNASNSPASVPLAGTGITLQITPSPANVSFGNVGVGSNASATVMLSNTGTSSVTITQATASGTGFSITGLSLPITLNAGQNTNFNAVFSPSVAGNATGSISVVSTASNSPTAIALSGAGVTLVLTATPASVSFGNVTAGNNSVQVVSLKNTGTSSVTVSQATVSGSGFSISGLSLPQTLTAGQGANFNVTFAPSGAGNATGSVSIVSTAANSPLGISLSGTGVTLLLSGNPTSLSFGNVTVGQNNSLPVVLTNNGSASVTVSQANVTGSGFSISGLNLPVTLGAQQNTGFNVTFSPTVAGNASGSVSIVSTATDSPTVESLSGVGVNAHSVSLSWSASTSQSVIGYNMFRATASGGPYTQINSSLITGTTYTDTNVQAGTTYYYVATAVNSQQTQSAYSNQAKAGVPSP